MHGDLKPTNVLLKSAAPGSSEEPRGGGGGAFLAEQQQQAATAAAAASSLPSFASSSSSSSSPSEALRAAAASAAHPAALDASRADARSFTCKLCDFGLSRLVDVTVQTYVSTLHYGTIAYQPPEVLRTGRMSRASDAYAFGLIALEIATGEKVSWFFFCFEASERVRSERKKKSLCLSLPVDLLPRRFRYSLALPALQLTFSPFPPLYLHCTKKKHLESRSPARPSARSSMASSMPMPGPRCRPGSRRATQPLSARAGPRRLRTGRRSPVSCGSFRTCCGRRWPRGPRPRRRQRPSPPPRRLRQQEEQRRRPFLLCLCSNSSRFTSSPSRRGTAARRAAGAPRALRRREMEEKREREWGGEEKIPFFFLSSRSFCSLSPLLSTLCPSFLLLLLLFNSNLSSFYFPRERERERKRERETTSSLVIPSPPSPPRPRLPDKSFCSSFSLHCLFPLNNIFMLIFFHHRGTAADITLLLRRLSLRPLGGEEAKTEERKLLISQRNNPQNNENPKSRTVPRARFYLPFRGFPRFDSSGGGNLFLFLGSVGGRKDRGGGNISCFFFFFAAAADVDATALGGTFHRLFLSPFPFFVFHLPVQP